MAKAGRKRALQLEELDVDGERVTTMTGPKPLRLRDLLLRLGSIMSTTKEVAAVLGVTEPTLFALFKRQPEAKEIYQRGKESGKASLRRAQFALAEKNATMGIFLGLNYLDQKDRREFTGRDGKPLFPAEIDIDSLSTEQLIALRKRLKV